MSPPDEPHIQNSFTPLENKSLRLTTNESMEHSPDTINQQQPQDTKARPQLHTQRSQHQTQSSQKKEKNGKKIYLNNEKTTTTKTVNSKHISLSTQLQSATSDMTFNPFIVPACKMSVLKTARTRLQNSIFSGPAANGL